MWGRNIQRVRIVTRNENCTSEGRQEIERVRYEGRKSQRPIQTTVQYESRTYPLKENESPARDTSRSQRNSKIKHHQQKPPQLRVNDSKKRNGEWMNIKYKLLRDKKCYILNQYGIVQKLSVYKCKSRKSSMTINTMFEGTNAKYLKGLERGSDKCPK